MNRYIMPQDEQKQRFKVGSQVFFDGYPGYQPKDLDEVEFEENPKLYRNFMQFRKKDGSRCLFKWRKMTADEFVEYTLNSNLPMELGKFLVPEVVNYLGFTIEHLKKLEPVAARLDDKHKYEQIIYKSYILNNDWILTKEQRDLAYEEYRKERGVY